MKAYAGYMIGRTGKTSFLISEKTGLSKTDHKYLYNIGQHYGEWAEPADVHAMSYKDFMKSQPEVATAYLSYVMGIMVEIGQELGKREDVKLYQEYRDGAKKTYQKLVERPGFGLDTDRQAKLVRPLYFQLLNDKQTAYARDRLIKALDHYKWRIGTGFLSTPLILYVLGDIDIEYAYRLLENEERPGRLCMPGAGATTIWEDWEGPDSVSLHPGRVEASDMQEPGTTVSTEGYPAGGRRRRMEHIPMKSPFPPILQPECSCREGRRFSPRAHIPVLRGRHSRFSIS